MRIKVKVSPRNNIRPSTYLIVSNHLSYLDILILSAYFPACFVTSIEIKNTFGLGHLARLAACLFVERRSRKNIIEEVSEVTQALVDGTSVVLFPEATSTNGTSILKFKKSLFKSAILSQSNILPISINYQKLENEQICTANRDIVFWYGEMSFLSHLLSFFKQSSLTVEIYIEDSIIISKNKSYGDLADHSYQQIKDNYTPITC